MAAEAKSDAKAQLFNPALKGAIKRAFRYVDVDCSGEIDPKELVEFFKKMVEVFGVESMKGHRWKRYDTNLDYVVDYAEFEKQFIASFGHKSEKEIVAAVAALSASSPNPDTDVPLEIRRALIDAFNKIDVDKSGSIDAQEMVEFFKKIYETFGPAGSKESRFEKYDLNKDGKIEYNEFESVILRTFGTKDRLAFAAAIRAAGNVRYAGAAIRGE